VTGDGGLVAAVVAFVLWCALLVVVAIKGSAFQAGVMFCAFCAGLAVTLQLWLPAALSAAGAVWFAVAAVQKVRRDR
jgi:hypothetical protein